MAGATVGRLGLTFRSSHQTNRFDIMYRVSDSAQPALEGEPATDGPNRLLEVGLAVVASVFLLLVYFAAETLDHAIRHRGYYSSFHDAGSSGFSSAPAPTYGDAGWFFLLGPGLQLGLFGLFVALASASRRRSWRRRLGITAVAMLMVDLLLVFVIFAIAEASVI